MRIALCTLACATSACAVNYDYATGIRFQDPTAVSVVARGETALAAKSGPARVEVARGEMPMGPDSTGRYRLEVTRGARGDIGLYVDSRVPFTDGDTHKIVRDDGTLITMATPAIEGPKDGRFALDLCANADSYASHGHVDYFMNVTTTCGASGTTSLGRLTLTTPAANVAEIRSERKNLDRGPSLATLLVIGLPMVAGGIIAMAEVDDPALQFGVGIPVIALGAWLSAFALSVIFTPDTSVVTYPP